MGDFWALLEGMTASRHASLLGRLNVHLADLARRVEGVVATRLQVGAAGAGGTTHAEAALAGHLHSGITWLCLCLCL